MLKSPARISHSSKGVSNITSSVSVLKAVYALRDLNLAVPKSWSPALRGRRVLVGSYRLVADNEVPTPFHPRNYFCVFSFSIVLQSYRS